jgi:hypothetical protein
MSGRSGQLPQIVTCSRTPHYRGDDLRLDELLRTRDLNFSATTWVEAMKPKPRTNGQDGMNRYDHDGALYASCLSLELPGYTLSFRFCFIASRISIKMSETYDHASKVEANGAHEHLERLRTAGGHAADRDQPSLPVVHRTFANPAPLGLLSFATGIFLISILGVHARGIQTPNVMIGVLMFFGGVCQFISGIMEFVTGNTVSPLLWYEARSNSNL